MKPWLGIRKLLFVMLVAVVVGVVYRKGRDALIPVHVSVAPPSFTPASPVSPSGPGARTGAARALHASPEQVLNRFRDRFGADLSAEFSQDGNLIAIHGRAGQGKGADKDFKPDDPQKAVARAREVLEQAQDLIGASPDWPLDAPAVRTGEASAQVIFHELHEGVPVEPYGSVTVDLGADGEVLRVDSGYVKNPAITNHITLDEGMARLKAIAAIPETPGSSTLRVESGGTVIWVPHPGAGGTPEGRYAYEYYVQGRQIVVDAADGKILAKKDQRQF